MISFGLEIILGDDLFFCLCTSIVWRRACSCARSTVLEARGLRCGVRAAFCGAVGHAVSLREMGGDQRRFQRRRVYPIGRSR